MDGIGIGTTNNQPSKSHHHQSCQNNIWCQTDPDKPWLWWWGKRGGNKPQSGWIFLNYIKFCRPDRMVEKMSIDTKHWSRRSRFHKFERLVVTQNHPVLPKQFWLKWKQCDYHVAQKKPKVLCHGNFADWEVVIFRKLRGRKLGGREGEGERE